MNKPYWECENPSVVDAGKQRFKHYKQSGVIEICSKIDENGKEKEFRRQTISAYKLQSNEQLQSMMLDFLEAAGLICKVDNKEA
jgi:hypothetical protein